MRTCRACSRPADNHRNLCLACYQLDREHAANTTMTAPDGLVVHDEVADWRWDVPHRKVMFDDLYGEKLA